MNETDAHTREPQELAYLGLGSNIGDREHYLLEAVRLLTEHPQIVAAGCSGLYETEPVGYVEQEAFLNMVVAVSTTLSPEALFHEMLRVEHELGRKREIRWGPRTIDLDLLLFGDRVQNRPDLILPHPRMMERAFVLVPLVDVMTQREPLRAESFRERLEAVEGKEGVLLWKKTC
ncbi:MULTISPECIES: 2-amino-4-hydroxy-6-hydroxymethyldihydropteridine diphosphokinase [Paenibacillus]|uniref:2-amino-4-hydroxy-6- hydroxymethyldihydropteridine diphosphokinase n=1 Tax=Paenibacillus TaxID=44249 RepID=UPI001915D346|nr:2-amino-4-hydroxy-6-hydroxymethyldihydropteridine diphosphokinase [Paenibacillus sp. EPM92]